MVVLMEMQPFRARSRWPESRHSIFDTSHFPSPFHLCYAKLSAPRHSNRKVTVQYYWNNDTATRAKNNSAASKSRILRRSRRIARFGGRSRARLAGTLYGQRADYRLRVQRRDRRNQPRGASGRGSAIAGAGAALASRPRRTSNVAALRGEARIEHSVRHRLAASHEAMLVCLAIGDGFVHRADVVPHQHIAFCPSMRIAIPRLKLVPEQRLQQRMAFRVGQAVDTHRIAWIGVQHA